MSENTGAGSEVKVSPEVKDLFDLRIKAAGGIIREPKKYDLPNDYDTSKLSGVDRTYADTFIRKATDYLSFPSFYVASNDRARDKFKANLQRQMEKVYGERGVKELNVLWQRNKLRSNNLNYLVVVSEFAETANIPQGLVKNLLDSIDETLIYEMGTKMEELSQEQKDSKTSKMLGPEEKIQQAEKISDNLVKILRFMGKKS